MVDLSDRVVVGEPVQKSKLEWSVPYNVKDDAGNAAETIWRTVLVEPVDLANVEDKIRAEIQREQDAVVQRAVEQALAEERRNNNSNNSNSRGSSLYASRRGTNNNNQAMNCPTCPPCNCDGKPSSTGFDFAKCDEYCASKSFETCTMEHLGLLGSIMQFLELYLTRSMAYAFVLLGSILLFVLTLHLILKLLMGAFTNRTLGEDDAKRELAMQNSFKYYPNGTSETTAGMGSPPPTSSTGRPPRNSISTTSAPLFSPGNQSNNGFGSPTGMYSPPGMWSPPPSNSGNTNRSPSIYADDQEPIITPSATGDGVRRRSPFSSGNRY